MSVLGPWGTTDLIGKLKKARTDLSAHIAVTAAGVHGSTVAATANRLVHRDAAGRAQVADPAVNADIANRGWVLAQLSGVGSGTVTSVGSGTGLTGGPITGSGTLSLTNTGVAAGTYAYGSFTVDAQGRITSASANAPVLSVSAAAGAGMTSTGGQNPTISMVPSNPSQNGYMSAAQAAKLDGIQTGAQQNAITSVFGRSGAITANAGDYTIQKISGVTVSTAAPSGGADGDLWFQVA